MNWFEISSITAVCAFGLALITTCVVLLFRYIIPNVKHWQQFTKNLVGTVGNARTGTTFQPSIFERLNDAAVSVTNQNAVLEKQDEALAGIVQTLSEVKEQVANTHSTNLRDDMDGLRDEVRDLHAKVDKLATAATTVNVTQNPTTGATP